MNDKNRFKLNSIFKNIYDFLKNLFILLFWIFFVLNQFAAKIKNILAENQESYSYVKL